MFTLQEHKEGTLLVQPLFWKPQCALVRTLVWLA